MIFAVFDMLPLTACINRSFFYIFAVVVKGYSNGI